MILYNAKCINCKSELHNKFTNGKFETITLREYWAIGCSDAEEMGLSWDEHEDQYYSIEIYGIFSCDNCNAKYFFDDMGSLICIQEPDKDKKKEKVLEKLGLYGSIINNGKRVYNNDPIEQCIYNIMKRHNFNKEFYNVIDIRTLKQEINTGTIKCYLCKNAIATEIEHKVPISRGGKSEKQNMFPVCKRCNVIKSNFSVEEIRNVANYIEENEKLGETK